MERLGKLLYIFAVIHVFQSIGVQCQMASENIALYKPVWQLSQHSPGDNRFDASNAVDGRKSDLNWSGGQCTFSADLRQTATLRVDLEDIVSIHHITIYYRTGKSPWGSANRFTGRSLGFSLYVSNTTDRTQGKLCFHDTSYTKATIPAVLTVTCPVHARYVIYYNERLPGVTYPSGYSQYAYSDLCEVEVYVTAICGEPPTVKRATISDGGNTQDTIRTYSCYQNTSTEGNTTITCGQDGNWTSTDLYCRPICGEPPTVERATISDGGNVEGVNRTYTCNPNTHTEGITTIICGPDGQWTNTNLYCRPSCGPPPTIPRAKVSKGDNLQGTTRRYSCLGNTIMSGIPTITCGMDGKWSKTDFTCLWKREHSSSESSWDSSMEEYDYYTDL